MLPFLIILATKLFSGESPPQISITSWLPSEQFQWISAEDETEPPITPWGNSSTTLKVPASVQGIILTCNASYPVQWDFTHGHMDDDQRRKISLDRTILSKRTATNIFDPSTFVYIAELRLTGDDNFLTGNYSCVSCTEANFRSTLYLFWEGNSPPYLVDSGDNMTIYYEEPKVRSGQDTVIIPCRVSEPNVEVNLNKQVNGTWANFDTSGVTYDPTIGFTLNIDRRENSFGHFRCGTYTLVDDIVYVNVVAENYTYETPSIPEFLEGNATFTYDETNRSFRCCSTSYDQPILQIVYCDHPTMCQIKKQQMDEITNNGKRHSDSSCTSTTITFQTSGIIKCIGDGVSIFREYFFPTSIGIAGILNIQRSRNYRKFIVSGKPYYKWDEANPQEMISIESSPSVVYAGEYFKVTCQASQYYFAQGIRWGILWANDTKHVQPDVDPILPLLSKFYFYPGISRRTMLAELNMTAISCFAPVWNSSVYIEKSVVLSIKEPRAPWIDDGYSNSSDHVQILWDMGETNKSLECTVHGEPSPNIVWTRDGHTISDSYTRNNGTMSVIKIGTVSISSGGVYSCSASNLAGNAMKTFHVEVNVPMSALVITSVIVAVSLFIATIAFIIFLIRKNMAQKDSIENLKSVAFRDVLEQRRSSAYVSPAPTVTDFQDENINGTVNENGNGIHGFGGFIVSSSNYQKF